MNNILYEKYKLYEKNNVTDKADELLKKLNNAGENVKETDQQDAKNNARKKELIRKTLEEFNKFIPKKLETDDSEEITSNSYIEITPVLLDQYKKIIDPNYIWNKCSKTKKAELIEAAKLLFESNFYTYKTKLKMYSAVIGGGQFEKESNYHAGQLALQHAVASATLNGDYNSAAEYGGEEQKYQDQFSYTIDNVKQRGGGTKTRYIPLNLDYNGARVSEGDSEYSNKLRGDIPKRTGYSNIPERLSRDLSSFIKDYIKLDLTDVTALTVIDRQLNYDDFDKNSKNIDSLRNRIMNVFFKGSKNSIKINSTINDFIELGRKLLKNKDETKSMFYGIIENVVKTRDETEKKVINKNLLDGELKSNGLILTDKTLDEIIKKIEELNTVISSGKAISYEEIDKKIDEMISYIVDDKENIIKDFVRKEVKEKLDIELDELTLNNIVKYIKQSIENPNKSENREKINRAFFDKFIDEYNKIKLSLSKAEDELKSLRDEKNNLASELEDAQKTFNSKEKELTKKEKEIKGNKLNEIIKKQKTLKTLKAKEEELTEKEEKLREKIKSFLETQGVPYNKGNLFNIDLYIKKNNNLTNIRRKGYKEDQELKKQNTRKQMLDDLINQFIKKFTKEKFDRISDSIKNDNELVKELIRSLEYGTTEEIEKDEQIEKDIKKKTVDYNSGYTEEEKRYFKEHYNDIASEQIVKSDGYSEEIKDIVENWYEDFNDAKQTYENDPSDNDAYDAYIDMLYPSTLNLLEEGEVGKKVFKFIEKRNKNRMTESKYHWIPRIVDLSHFSWKPADKADDKLRTLLNIIYTMSEKEYYKYYSYDLISDIVGYIQDKKNEEISKILEVDDNNARNMFNSLSEENKKALEIFILKEACDYYKENKDYCIKAMIKYTFDRNEKIERMDEKLLCNLLLNNVIFLPQSVDFIKKYVNDFNEDLEEDNFVNLPEAVIKELFQEVRKYYKEQLLPDFMEKLKEEKISLKEDIKEEEHKYSIHKPGNLHKELKNYVANEMCKYYKLNKEYYDEMLNNKLDKLGNKDKKNKTRLMKTLINELFSMILTEKGSINQGFINNCIKDSPDYLKKEFSQEELRKIFEDYLYYGDNKKELEETKELLKKLLDQEQELLKNLLDQEQEQLQEMVHLMHKIDTIKNERVRLKLYEELLDIFE